MKNKTCINCGKSVSRHSFQCRSCYMTLSTKTKQKCIFCVGKLSKFSSASGKQRCRPCYDHERSHQGKPWQDQNILETLYYQKQLSFESIAKLLGCGHTTVTKWCTKFAIKSRPAPFMKNGPVLLGYNNYIDITVHGIRIPQHRYFVEQFIGRKLLRTEQVHHIDGNKSNNELSNLHIFTTAEHRKFHNLPYPLKSNLYKFVNDR